MSDINIPSGTPFDHDPYQYPDIAEFEDRIISLESRNKAIMGGMLLLAGLVVIQGKMLVNLIRGMGQIAVMVQGQQAPMPGTSTGGPSVPVLRSEDPTRIPPEGSVVGEPFDTGQQEAPEWVANDLEGQDLSTAGDDPIAEEI